MGTRLVAKIRFIAPERHETPKFTLSIED